MSELEAEPAGDRADGARAEESEVTSYTSDIPVANLKDSITLETTVTDPSAVINGIDETESPTSHKEYNTANPADVATMDTEDWNLDLSENKSNSQEVGSVMNEGTEEVDTTQTSVNEEEETQLKVDSEQQDKPDEGSVIRESSESKGNEIQSVENSEEMQSYDAHGPLQNLTAEADQKASNGNICEVEEPDQETSNSNISEEIQTGDAKENEEGNNAEETGGQETDMLCNQSLDIHAAEDTIEDDTSQDFNQEIIGYSISETEDAAFTESQQEDDVSVNKETENNNMNVDDESAIKDMSVEGNEDFICQENSNSQDSEQLSSNPEDLEDVTVTKKDDNAVSVELTEKEDNNQLNEERNQLLNEDNQLIDEDNTQKSEDCKQLQNEKADHTSTTNLQTCEDNYDGLSSISIQNVESHAVTDDSIHAGSQEEIFQENDLLKDNDIKMDTSSEEKVDEDDLLKEDENTDKVHEKKSADESVSGSTDNKVIMDMDDQMGDNDTSDQVMSEQVTGDSTGEVKEVADVEMADTETSVAQTTELDSEKVTEGKSTVTLVDEEAKTAVKSEKEATKDQDGKMEDNSATEIKVEAKKRRTKGSGRDR